MTIVRSDVPLSPTEIAQDAGVRPRAAAEASAWTINRSEETESAVETWLAETLPRATISIAPARSVAQNLAIDHSLVRSAKADERVDFRLWWGTDPTIVLGSSEKAAVVADLARCLEWGVGLVRRQSGGGAILETPGVLNYSLITPAPQAFWVTPIFHLAGRILVDALEELGLRAQLRGTSDIAVGDLKVSGNAMARRGGGLLVHRTLLYDLDLDLVESCLRHPPREPGYRRGRSHSAFVTSLRGLGLGVSKTDVERILVQSFFRLARDPHLFSTALSGAAAARSGADTSSESL
jgi:lipoate---protein ligase